MIWDFFGIFGQNCLCCRQRHVFLGETRCVFSAETRCVFLGETGSLLWQDKISVVAGRNVCCGKTSSLLWQDKISVVARNIREAAAGRLHKGGRRFAPPPFVDSLMSCHSRDLVLPQQSFCLATTHILSCHNRDLVLPQQRSCLAKKNRR